MKNFAKISLLCASLFCAASANAETRLQDAEKYVQTLGDKVVEYSKDSKSTPQQRRDNIIALVDSVIDAEWISKFVLSKNYKMATQEQRDRFSNIYRAFMVNTYGPKFENYKGEKFQITKSLNQNRQYIIKALFYSTETEPVSVDFRVRDKNDNQGFVVIDIVAEGVSLIETQRAEFNSVIASEGLDNFLKNMEVRVAKLKAENQSAGKKSKQ